MGISSIDAHPLRNQLIDMLLRGEGHSKVAAVVGLSKQAVAKYAKKHIKPALSAGCKPQLTNAKVLALVNDTPGGMEQARAEVNREAFLARLRKHEGTMDRAIEEAAASKEFSGLASVASARKGHLELEAKIGGLLNEAPVSTVNITVLQAGTQVVESQTVEADWTTS